MEKYRIVQVKFPELTKTDGTVNFVPEIQHWSEYHVEYQKRIFFGLYNTWIKLGIFNSLERAERQVQFYLEQKTRKVVKEY